MDAIVICQMLDSYWLLYEPEHNAHFTHSSISGFSSAVVKMGEFLRRVLKTYFTTSLDAKSALLI
jgi:hypothetical protein